MTASMKEMTDNILNDDTVSIKGSTFSWDEVAQD
jgi:hypothetical protein